MLVRVNRGKVLVKETQRCEQHRKQEFTQGNYLAELTQRENARYETNHQVGQQGHSQAFRNN